MLSKKQEEEALLKIGGKIRELRELNNLTQFSLAYDSNLSKNQIGRIERGENKISVIAVIKIAKALKVNVKEIFADF
uniref:helix-turn-helix domain-containing protein n=1 Tax=Mariniflexile sp. TaxID=1979402 RepID=UPI0040473805